MPTSNLHMYASEYYLVSRCVHKPLKQLLFQLWSPSLPLAQLLTLYIIIHYVLLLQNEVFNRDIIENHVLYMCILPLPHYQKPQAQYPLHHLDHHLYYHLDHLNKPVQQVMMYAAVVPCTGHWVHEQLHVSCAHDKNTCTHIQIILMHYYSSGHIHP